MPEESTFTHFLRRIRAGDEQAAVELVRQYESLIRREVRLRLEDQSLCRLFDSMDICQSVLASFFVRTAAGQYDLENPQQLVGLLVSMARKKVASAARRQHQQRRDSRRDVAGTDRMGQLTAPGPTPGEAVAGKELLDRFRHHLSEEERLLIDLRNEGLPWASIADRLGGTAQARRMQLSRAVERVTRELGLDDDEP